MKRVALTLVVLILATCAAAKKQTKSTLQIKRCRLLRYLPLKCQYLPSIEVRHLYKIETARSLINDLVGLNLVSPCRPLTKATEQTTGIILSVGELEPPAVGMAYSTDRLKGINYYRIVVKKKSYAATQHFVWLHEFGHTLGLEHDDLERSIMRPLLNPGYLLPEHLVKLRKKHTVCLDPE